MQKTIYFYTPLLKINQSSISIFSFKDPYNKSWWYIYSTVWNWTDLKMSIVSLNVGGTTFQTSPETMVKFPNSKLATMSKPGKVFFLDHNPKYFEVVLDFLRYGKVMTFEDENFFDGVHDLAKDLELQGVQLITGHV